ncbi:MAG TPA: hypothetical protein VF753_18790 [Terriglobales bacterium]
MKCWTEGRWSLFALLIAASFALAQAPATPPEGVFTAKIVSVRQIKQTNSFPMSRFPTVARFTVDFAFKYGAGNYSCTAYETPVLDEVQDLVSANGKEVTVEIHGKKILVTLPSGRKIHGELVKETQC